MSSVQLLYSRLSLEQVVQECANRVPLRTDADVIWHVIRAAETSHSLCLEELRRGDVTRGTARSGVCLCTEIRPPSSPLAVPSFLTSIPSLPVPLLAPLHALSLQLISIDTYAPPCRMRQVRAFRNILTRILRVGTSSPVGHCCCLLHYKRF